MKVDLSGTVRQDKACPSLSGQMFYFFKKILMKRLHIPFRQSFPACDIFQ